MSGFIVIIIAMLFSAFLAVKAVFEAYMTTRSSLEPLHKRAHIAALGAIIAYNFFDIFSYAWFPLIYSDFVDYTVGFFNLTTLNVIWLFIIDHFRQERLGNITRSNWKELFKF